VHDAARTRSVSVTRKWFPREASTVTGSTSGTTTGANGTTGWACAWSCSAPMWTWVRAGVQPRVAGLARRTHRRRLGSGTAGRRPVDGQERRTWHEHLPTSSWTRRRGPARRGPSALLLRSRSAWIWCPPPRVRWGRLAAEAKPAVGDPHLRGAGSARPGRPSRCG
jgi:hypothetical protein